MLLGFALIGEQFIARQFDRRHVGHVFVVDDEIDRVVREGQGFGIGPGSQASPAALFGPLGLQLQERAGDVERDVPDALPFEWQ